MRTEENKSQGSKAGSVISQSEVEPVRSASRAQGFSLVELLVVMAVLLIVGAIATPTIATTMSKTIAEASLLSAVFTARRKNASSDGETSPCTGTTTTSPL